MNPLRWLRLAAVPFVLFALSGLAQTVRHGSLTTETIDSTCLCANRIGLDPRRSVIVYLPPSYATSGRAYPVIYYCHGLGTNNAQLFADGRVQRILDRAISAGVVGEFILVAADYSSPTVGSLFENSDTSGRWLDFTVKELVPFVDGHFRTLANRDSRGVSGDSMGAYGALKLAMCYPEVFGAVYALHPVGTGTGVAPLRDRVDWQRIYRARSFQDLGGDFLAKIFVGIAQAYLPNPDRPPFCCDFMVELKNGKPEIDVAHTEKIQAGFLLDHLPLATIDHLRRLRGVAFDWARYDPNPDHVFSNQVFTRKLEELGIEHEAEEYDGVPGASNWTDEGRVYREMLPFFARHLVFSAEPAR